ncbi:MAG: hypothetical protein KBH07_06910 [Flavobacteriales bacterium]|nr:hypothetical protein [Flavobacteriales bacterium]MBP9080642.1 hypothetical protein [Flavobacteriales bacterium]
MQRLIRSFNTLTDELRDKLQEQYPDGIDNSHIRTVNTPKGETLRVIELRTPEAMYLIKINAESRGEIDEFLEQEGGGEDRDGEDIEGVDGLEGAEEEEEEENDAPPADGDDDEEEEAGAVDGEDDDED